MPFPLKTRPVLAGDASARPDPGPDAAERLAVAGQLLADVSQHIASARALLRAVADDEPAHAVADLLAVAGWLADFGAKLAGEPGHIGDPQDWFMRPTTRAAVAALGTGSAL